MSFDVSKVGTVPDYITKSYEITEAMSPIQRIARDSIRPLLPALYSHMKVKTNPHAKTAQEDTIAWGKRCGLLPDNDENKHVKGIRRECFGIFAANCHPQAAPEVTSIACKFATWLFAADDFIEKYTSEADLIQLFDTIHQICLNPAIAKESKNPFLKGIGEIIEEMDAYLVKIHCDTFNSETWKNRFVKAFDKHLTSTLWELRNQKANEGKGRIPPFAEYMKRRYHTSATPLSFLFILLDKKIDFTDKEFKSPVVKGAMRSGAFKCNHHNDAVSDEKEEEHCRRFSIPVIHNAVHVIKHHEQIQDMSRAFARVAEELLKEHQTYIELGTPEKIKEFEGPSEKVYKVRDGIDDWLSSYYDWGSQCPRYGGPGFPASYGEPDTQPS